jgi:hypothetical protein
METDKLILEDAFETLGLDFTSNNAEIVLIGHSDVVFSFNTEDECTGWEVIV